MFFFILEIKSTTKAHILQLFLKKTKQKYENILFIIKKVVMVKQGNDLKILQLMYDKVTKKKVTNFIWSTSTVIKEIWIMCLIIKK